LNAKQDMEQALMEVWRKVWSKREEKESKESGGGKGGYLKEKKKIA
jgi:hypothetical protein